MADSQQLLKLTEGVAAWNRWRSENPDVSIDLRGADLRDAELPRANPRDANLVGCDFRDAILDSADVSSADLSKANLTRAKMRGALAVGANLRSIKLNQVDATTANFYKANLNHSSINSAQLVGVNMSHAVCKDAVVHDTNFASSTIYRSDFRDSNLSGSQFIGVSLEATDLRRCQLDNVSFESAILTNANLRFASLINVDLAGAKVTHANFRDVVGLTCDRLTNASDWKSAFRDPRLACDAMIPVEDATDDITNELSSTTGAVPLIDDLFGAELSRLRQDVAETEWRAQLERSRKALFELEKTLTDLRDNVDPGQMGHNNPPEPMNPREVLEQHIAEVRAGLELHDAPRPDKVQLSRLRDILGRFRQWLQPRIDTAADSAAKAFGTAIGVGAAALLLTKLSGAWDQLSTLINMLG